MKKKKIKLSKKLNKYFINQHYSPRIPFNIFPNLKKVANTSIDISDGLIDDLYKLINRQKLSFEIDLDHIPISNVLNNYLKKYKKKKENYLFYGDDYQILFTASKKYRNLIKNFSYKMNHKITIIGKINNKNKKNIVKFKNRPKIIAKLKGYSHKF